MLKSISLAGARATPISESPVQATCSSCRVNNVQLHPLVKSKLVPKKLADVFVYNAPPDKTKSRVKTVEKARIITSDEVRNEVLESEKRKREKNPKGKNKALKVSKSQKSK